ncbi:MFS transporter [Gottfriedia sp. NPDC057948]|uniref:MFS transporter n=1 Tax=Gottfriedia sp. NPDC057948 TaxID=3346287 RepID=UPI0036DA7C38
MRDNIIIPVWSIGSFLIVMNTTMFNVSIPELITDLNISANNASWILSGYSIGFALATVIYSRLSDFIPIRYLLTFGLSILGVSSILGFFSNTFEFVLIARLLQSCGAGAVPVLGAVLASRYVPLERRGKSLTILGSSAALGFGLGPIVGGMITAYLGWQMLFIVTTLVLPLSIVLWMLLPKEDSYKLNFDFIGAILVILTTASLLISISKLSILFFCLGIIFLILLIMQLRKVKNPFLQKELFQNHGYRKLIIVSFISFALNMSMLFLMPLVLGNGFHKSTATVGLLIFPGAALSTILIRFIGGWIDKFGNFLFLILGFCSMLLSNLIISIWIHESAIVLTIAYLCFAPALSTVTSALTNEVSGILPKEIVGSGIGLSLLFQYMGGAFAVALCGQLIEFQNQTDLITASQHIFYLLYILLLAAFVVLYTYWKYKQSIRKSTPNSKI